MAVDILKRTVVARFKHNQLSDIDTYMEEEGKKLTIKSLELQQLEIDIREENERLKATVSNLSEQLNNYNEYMTELETRLIEKDKQHNAMMFFQGA